MTKGKSFDFDYTASRTAAKFHASDAFVRLLMGPVGSGKSVACIAELFNAGLNQKPGRDGIRRTRWAVIRNTQPELKTTTIKTFHDSIPPFAADNHYTQGSPITQWVRFGDVEMEFIFLALDKEEDVNKLLSLELTGAFMNEAREQSAGILKALIQRVGRFPSAREGGPTKSFVILDTNPPDEESWIYKDFEENPKRGYAIFRQPSGMSPDADNIENLPHGYYQRIIDGAEGDQELINTMVHGEYGAVTRGVPVFKGVYSPDLHVAKEPLKPLPITAGKPVIIGYDFGLTPAAVFLQQGATGQWRIIHEVFLPDEILGAEQFAPIVQGECAKFFDPNQKFIHWGDPAGSQRSQADATATVYRTFQTHGILMRSAPTQNLTDRLACVRNPMARLIGGEPGLLVSPTCKHIKKALNGGYCYKMVRVSGGERINDQPEKNVSSHIADALQYGLAGGGEFALMNGAKGGRKAPTVAKSSFNVWNR
ncbi:MAG: hypothetical protein CMF62_06430 [Magnetococcales bacterium]|nr:hypothetical protein [Magnetococcales bacterium]